MMRIGEFEPNIAKTEIQFLEKLIQEGKTSEKNALTLPEMERDLKLNRKSLLKYREKLVSYGFLHERKKDAGQQTWHYYYVTQLGVFGYYKSLIDKAWGENKEAKEVKEILDKILDFLPLIKKYWSKAGNYDVLFETVYGLDYELIKINQARIISIDLQIFNMNNQRLRITKMFPIPFHKHDEIFNYIKKLISFIFYYDKLRLGDSIIKTSEEGIKMLNVIEQATKKKGKDDNNTIKLHQGNIDKAKTYLDKITKIIENDKELKTLISKTVIDIEESTKRKNMPQTIQSMLKS